MWITNAAGSVTSSVATLQVREVLQFVTTNGVMRIVNGSFQLRLVGMTPNSAVIIEGSTNLINWTPIHTNPAAISPMKYSDTVVTNQNYRFYRAKEMP